jgi:hypothetical protein
MAPSLSRGEQKRQLLPPDMELLNKIYPPTLNKDLEEKTLDFRAPLSSEEERFVIEIHRDFHRHLYVNDKYISCETNKHPVP